MIPGCLTLVKVRPSPEISIAILSVKIQETLHPSVANRPLTFIHVYMYIYKHITENSTLYNINIE